MILNDHFYWLLVRKLSHDKIAPQSKVDVIDVDISELRALFNKSDIFSQDF